MAKLLINSDLGMSGIYKAILLEGNKVYVPGITNFSLSDGSGSVNMDSYEEHKDALPVAWFCAFNRKCTENELPASCWVTFECGDVKRPIILGFQGKSIKSAIEDGGVMYMSGGDGSGTGEENTGETTNENGGGNNSSLDAWFESIKNTYVEHGTGSPGTQCTDLVNDYVDKVLGHSNDGHFGNGKDYAKGISDSKKWNNKSYFDFIKAGSGLKVGDIVSSESFSGNNAGHVSIVKSVNGNKVTLIEQGTTMTARTNEYTIKNGRLYKSNGGNIPITGIARPK